MLMAAFLFLSWPHAGGSHFSVLDKGPLHEKGTGRVASPLFLGVGP